MNRFSVAIIILSIGILFSISSLPTSEAKLWDYIVNSEFLKNPISEGDDPILFGTIVDHAYRPVSNVEIKISFAGDSYIVKSDEHGEFGKKFESLNLKPREYSVQIIAISDDGKKSMTRTTLQIEGHVEKSAKYEQELESMELANDLSKLRMNSNDPVSVILYQHYLKLQDKVTQAKYEEELLDVPQQKIREIRKQVNNELIDILDKRPLPTRQFDDSIKLSEFLNTLDDEKRYLFELQMNSTKIRFIEAQNIMHNLLINGTSYDNARLAYLDHLSITQEEMSSFTKNMEKSENPLKPLTNSTEN